MKRNIFLAGFIAAAAMVAAPVFAQTNELRAPAPVPPVKGGFECVQVAVDAREASVGTAFTTFSTAETAALSARKSALHDAWVMTAAKDRRTARNKAWSDFRAANKAAFTAMRTTHKGAWTAFEAASKACKVDVVETPNMEGAGSIGL